MSKYMIRASYTRQGLQGLIKEGGSSRRAAIEAAVASAGGELESMYYAFGDEDVFFIVELPDNASAAGLSLLISSVGAISCQTTVLLTPEEIDEAVKVELNYRAPGA